MATMTNKTKQIYRKRKIVVELLNNDGRSKDTAASSTAVPTVKCVDGGNVPDIEEDYKKQFFTSDERRICLTGWIEKNNLKNGELASDWFAGAQV
eukprot:11217893-Ditylum_brightwellii.AAC.1